MLGKGLSYGWLAARRRIREMVLPAVTTATGAFLVVIGLGHRVHHQPTKMSGGEQQRTAIARSLISNPTLVLADEPTANLDHRTGETVVRMLRDLCSTLGVTVVASTHDPTVADEASRVVRMKDGQIVN
jgi:putative ABC transport system ATP-binding protein